MRGTDRAALAVAAGHGVAEVVSTVEDVQRAVTRRAYDLVGPAATVPRRVQEGATAGVYAAVRVIGGLVALGSARALESIAPPEAVALEETRAGAQWMAALSCAFGDHLEAGGSPLAPAIGLRQEGRAVPADAASLALAYPGATGRLVLFAHGLAGTEFAWTAGADGGGPVASYGDRLATDLGVTPVFLRYNSGRHVSTNGRELADLLARVVRAWPVPVTELVLVGHSMGGLVLRSACHYGRDADLPWVPLVTDVFALGTPHHGAPLERAANVAAVALGLAPESAPLGRLLDRRSAGVKDLRYGYVTDEAWRGRQPDLLLSDHAEDVPLLGSARHHFVAATVCRRPDGRLAGMVGDLMVLPASATGHGRTARRERFPLDVAHHVGGVHHLALLDHPAVYRLLRDSLAARCS